MTYDTAAPRRMLGVGVVGLGVGEQHATAFARLAGCEVRALCDLDASKAIEVAARIGQGRPVKDFRTVTGDPGIDVVAIATFDDMHFGQLLDALEAGKHAFVEKPLCRSLEEARRIKARWEECRTLHVASNLVLRAAPLYRWLRAEINDGRFGEIYAIDGEYLYGRLHKITEGWRKDVTDYSVMLGGGVHMVDLMLWLTGQRPASVTAAGNRISTRGTAFEYPDYVSSTFSFAGGLIGRITANFGCVHAHQHVLRVFGTNATFIYDDRGARLHATRDPDVPATSLALSPLPATKGDLIPDFIAGVQNRVDPAPALQHELDVICSCAAADRALALGRAVPVEFA